MEQLYTLTLDQLELSTSNPRRTFDETSLQGLAQSIQTDGLLQNLVVAQPKGRKKKFTIISGERRFRALQSLLEHGAISADYPVKVDIRRDLDENTAHRIATVENVQRENMNPIEEAEAVAKLLVGGMPLVEVSAQTGLSEKTIRRRLAITELCKEAKVLLENGDIALSQAEALTTGTKEQQRELLDHGNLEYFDATEIRKHFLDAKPTVSRAIFPLEQYNGTFSGDLFTEDEERYFDDVQQFLRLQTRAVEDMVVAFKTEGWVSVEIVECFQRWKYREAKEDELGGVWIVFNCRTGQVEVHQGWVLEVSESMDEETKPKPTTKYTTSLYRYMAMHKSMAVQAELLLNPRKAKEVAVMRLFSMKPHRCVGYFDDPEIAPAYWHVMEAEASVLLDALVETRDEEQSASHHLLSMSREDKGSEVYEKVKALSDDLLDRLHLLLTTLTFGQLCPEIPDTEEDSLFNRVAFDLGTDMSLCWIPDDAFFSRRNKDQLSKIVEESGTGRLFGSMMLTAKKSDLVRKMTRYFARLSTVETSDEIELQAQRWLPEAMRFPAVDPDVQIEVDAS